MKPEEAEKIVQNYGGAVASLKKGDAVLPLSALPNSKARIKYAFYVYIEELTRLDAMEEDHTFALLQTYALLNTRFQKEADKINDLHRQWKSSESARAKLEEYGGYLVGLPSDDDMYELAEFIDECKLR